MEGRHAGGRGYRWVARPGGLLLPISPTTIRASPAAYATHALRYWKGRTGVKSLLVSGKTWQLADSSIEELTRKLLEPARGVEPPTC